MQQLIQLPGLEIILVNILSLAKSYIAKKIGKYNAFGDEQTDADLKADEIIFDHLRNTEVVRAAMSKESPTVTLYKPPY